MKRTEQTEQTEQAEPMRSMELTDLLDGAHLRRMREQAGLTLDEVAPLYKVTHGGRTTSVKGLMAVEGRRHSRATARRYREAIDLAVSLRDGTKPVTDAEIADAIRGLPWVIGECFDLRDVMSRLGPGFSEVDIERVLESMVEVEKALRPATFYGGRGKGWATTRQKSAVRSMQQTEGMSKIDRFAGTGDRSASSPKSPVPSDQSNLVRSR